jgi:ferredoxin
MLLDKFFSSGEAKDPYYLQKRENMIVLGFACNQPVSTCFCTSLGGSPFGKDGMDLLLQEINDRYLIEPVTQKGEELLKKFSGLKDATKADIEKAKKLAKAAEIRVKSTVSVGDINEKLDGMFDDPLWDQVAQKCLGCGICTFLCPTCVCFDILEEEGDRQRRVRIWDSCQFSCFTLETSGHNPRPSGKERMRQRIMHKFNYFVKNYEEISCVGCGRCVQECPVNLDIREIIGEISTKEVE